MNRYKLVSDNDGHKYIIKVGEENDFENWVEDMEQGNPTTKDFDECRINSSGWTFSDPQGY